MAGYPREVWELSGWLYEGQHGFRPGCSCKSQLFTVCQDITDSPDEGVRTDAIIIDFSKAFCLVDANENHNNQSGFEGSCMGKGISLRTFAES